MFRILLLISVLLVPQVGMAKKVYSPHTDAGEIEVESQTDIVRSADPAQDGRVRQQFELAMGITDWWHSGVYAVYQKPAGRDQYHYAATKWENIFVLPLPDTWSLEAGGYIEYIRGVPSSSTSDAVEGKLLLEWHGGPWRHTLNMSLKQVLVSSSTAEAGYAWRTQYAWPEIEMALEAYGNLGRVNQFLPLARQSHLIGPVITLEPWSGFEFELGWLMDPNAGPAYGDFKMNMELEF